MFLWNIASENLHYPVGGCPLIYCCGLQIAVVVIKCACSLEKSMV